MMNRAVVCRCITKQHGIFDNRTLQVDHFGYRPPYRDEAVQPALQLSPSGTLAVATVDGVGCVQLAVGPAKRQHANAGAHQIKCSCNPLQGRQIHLQHAIQNMYIW